MYQRCSEKQYSLTRRGRGAVGIGGWEGLGVVTALKVDSPVRTP